jgi:hypothetical protein
VYGIYEREIYMKNYELIEKIMKLVAEERRIGINILDLLHEIERRKAYSDLGYDGLFSFCVKELRYSEAQASRRIQAMRAVVEHPQLKEKIEKGNLTVTTVAQVQSHLKKQARAGDVASEVEKMELFTSLENQSAKEVEAKLQSFAGEEMSFNLLLKLNPAMKNSWDKIKSLSAHSTRGQDLEILDLLMKTWLNKNDPEEKIRKTSSTTTQSSPDPYPPNEPTSTYVKNEAVHHETPSSSRFISVKIKRFVWRRDGGKCTFCESKFALQYDHLQAFSKFGDNSPENLRLLCRSCNLSQGIKEFGALKMRRPPSRNS